MFSVICAAWFLNTLSTCFQVSFLVKSFIKLVITEYPAQIYEILYKGLSKKENHSLVNSIEKMTLGTMLVFILSQRSC